jgi:heme oxygenase
MTDTIMQRLRAETRAEHVATEAIPFSTAIVAGTLARAEYAAQLAAYLPVHRALESAVADARHPALVSVWTNDMVRTTLLEADLDELGVTDDDVRAARTESEAMASWITDLAATDPIAILGVLYVLEGSTLGGAVLRRHLADAFALTDAGLRYYSPYGTHPRLHWVAFGERVNAVVLVASEADRIVAAAAETFTRIGRILSALSAPRTAAVG